MEKGERKSIFLSLLSLIAIPVTLMYRLIAREDVAYVLRIKVRMVMGQMITMRLGLATFTIIFLRAFPLEFRKIVFYSVRMIPGLLFAPISYYPSG